MSERPSILDELGRELVRAARAEQARGSRAGRAGRAPRAIVVGLLALLGLAAVAAAATLILGRGDPIPAPPPGLVPAELQPVAGSARLAGLDVRDPDGGPPWDVRTSRGKTGAICATVGQVLDGELGLLGLDRRFRALPAGAADTCSRARPTGATLAGARAFRGGGRLGALTVVSGVAAPSVREAAVIVDGRTTRARLGSAGAFLAVLRGLPEELRPRLVLTEASGERTTLRFADSGEYIAADPSGGAPWTLDYISRGDGLRCLRARRERGPGSFDATVPKRCGPRSRPFVAIRRFVPLDRSLSTQPDHLWMTHPARTIVWGWTPRAASEVVLTGAGGPRRLRVDPGGRRLLFGSGSGSRPSGRGGFLAVLDGHVDPRDLRVSVDGRRLDPARALEFHGTPVGREPVPAWRSVASVAAAPGPGERLPIVPGSLSISGRAADPGGGPGWALRTWSVRRGARAAMAGAKPGRVCFAIGMQQGSRLVEPLPSGGRRTVGTGVSDRRCPSPTLLASNDEHPEIRVYVDDADAPAPRVARVVVAGLLGDGARAAELLGAGAARPLALGRHGTFLAVLGPEHARAQLRVRHRDAGGVRHTSPIMRMFAFGSPCVPVPGQSVRVADPDGGPSWVMARGRTDRHACKVIGRAIGSRLATLLDGSNRVFFDVPAEVLLTRKPRTSDRPLALRVSEALFTGPGLTAPGPPSTAQVARRTLAGRTIVSGSATGAVESVTLRTPRDVRTVRPGPGGLLLAVYDGVFYGGRVHAEAHMRDGRTIRQTFPIGRP